MAKASATVGSLELTCLAQALMKDPPESLAVTAINALSRRKAASTLSLIEPS